MLIGWYFELIIGSLLIIMINCQDNDPSPIDNEPEATVRLVVDTYPKSSIDTMNSLKLFACHECINCQDKSNLTIRTCHSDINMCFTIHKRMSNTNQIIRRGCSTMKGQCVIPIDADPLNSFDSVTCCTTPKCNQGIQLRPLLFLLLISIIRI